MIKLSDLKAVRAKMEPGPYTYAPCGAPAGSVDIRGSRYACEDPKEMCPQHEHIAEGVPLATALGIETTHAAADILIDGAEAARVWRAAEQHRDEYSAASTLLPPIGRDRDAVLSRLAAALSKVQP